MYGKARRKGSRVWTNNIRAGIPAIYAQNVSAIVLGHKDTKKGRRYFLQIPKGGFGVMARYDGRKFWAPASEVRTPQPDRRRR